MPNGLRGIRVTTGSVELVAGGSLVREIVLEEARGAPLTFDGVVEEIGDADWVEEVARGVFLVKAAFVQDPDTELLIAAPGVREIRLAAGPGVFWGGRSAAVTIEGVRFTSWDSDEGAAAQNVAMRPFLLYTDGSVVDIRDSEMLYLGGRSPSSAAGVAWLGGSSGTVTDSVFASNHVGLHGEGASSFVLIDNVIRDNSVHGLSLEASVLRMEGNRVYGNGSHGVVVSDGTLPSNVSRNQVHDNGGSGLVFQDLSGGATVLGNTIEDNGEGGIVVTSAGGVEVRNNEVRGHQVGIRVDGDVSDGVRLEGNRLWDNELGLDAQGGADRLSVHDLVVSGSDTGVVLGGSAAEMTTTAVAAADRAVVVSAPARLVDVTVRGPDTGVVVTSNGVELRTVDVRARDVGLQVAEGLDLRVESSSFAAPTPVDGSITNPVDVRLDSTGSASLPAWVGVALVLILVGGGILFLLRHRPLVRRMLESVGSLTGGVR